MAPAGQTFVFIDEDQQKKYSKSTLSAINAQVAKYAHKQRRTTTKSRSAPSSPPTTCLSQQDESAEATKTQDDQLNTRCRRTSDPALKSGKRASTELQKPCRQPNLPIEKARRRPSALASPVIVQNILNESSEPTEQEDEDSSDKLGELLQNLCNITKQPCYQAFPITLDREERTLIHYVFTEILRADFGMTTRLEDTFMGQLTKYALAFEVPLRWMIARAADQLNAKTGSPPLSVAYRNRELALNKLRDILENDSTTTDEAVGSIHHSLVHSPEFRNVHLHGADAVVEARGGIEEVIKQAQITCSDHLFLQYTFLEFDIKKLEELESLKSQFFNSLLMMQERAWDYAHLMSQMTVWASSVDLIDCTFAGGNLQKWSYTEQRKRVFSPKTALGHSLRQKFERSTSFMRKARLFGALFQLSALLIEFDSIGEKSLFLRRLEQGVADAAMPDPITGMPVVMTGTLIYVMGHTSRQVQQEIGETTYDAKGIPVAKSGIAAVKIFGLLLDSMRERLVEYLQDWLLGDVERNLTSEDVSAMSAVITQLWLQKMRGSSTTPEARDYFSG